MESLTASTGVREQYQRTFSVMPLSCDGEKRMHSRHHPREAAVRCEPTRSGDSSLLTSLRGQTDRATKRFASFRSRRSSFVVVSGEIMRERRIVQMLFP